MNLLRRPSKDLHAPPAIFRQFASIWEDPHQYGITCIQFILTLHDLTYMGTTLGYIVIQDLYIAWGLARGTLENSLWFSLARCKSFFCFSLVILLWFSLASIKPLDSDHKVALTLVAIHLCI
jgi:hypothetical protein